MFCIWIWVTRLCSGCENSKALRVSFLPVPVQTSSLKSRITCVLQIRTQGQAFHTVAWSPTLGRWQQEGCCEEKIEKPAWGAARLGRGRPGQRGWGRGIPSESSAGAQGKKISVPGMGLQGTDNHSPKNERKKERKRIGAQLAPSCPRSPPLAGLFLRLCGSAACRVWATRVVLTQSTAGSSPRPHPARTRPSAQPQAHLRLRVKSRWTTQRRADEQPERLPLGPRVFRPDGLESEGAHSPTDAHVFMKCRHGLLKPDITATTNGISKRILCGQEHSALFFALPAQPRAHPPARETAQGAGPGADVPDTPSLGPAPPP